ncbi:hypothetical protein CWI36_0804p0010 [Hamiltosporidium magnivora]|uniref:Uncharacterized protein n=1 Tax=Hamiltosporidium magnivora TaxID=148818 RepID=A0A4Q9L8X5_9MICR|nr:hypothetical protein CWI36_0804p0010 [Hamiltosporidium magnivora]
MDKKSSKSKNIKIKEKQQNDNLEADVYREDVNNLNNKNIDSKNKIKKTNKRSEISLKKVEDKLKVNRNEEDENLNILKNDNKKSGKKLDKNHIYKENSISFDNIDYKLNNSLRNKDLEIEGAEEIREYEKEKKDLKEEIECEKSKTEKNKKIKNKKREQIENKNSTNTKEESENKKSKLEENQNTITKEEKFKDTKSKTEDNIKAEIKKEESENRKSKTEDNIKAEIKKEESENRKSKTEDKTNEISKQKLEKIKRINKLIKDVNENEMDYGISTKRLAVLNLDWDFIKPEDIFFQFKSFLNSEDELISVNFCKKSNEKDDLPEIGTIKVDGKEEKDKDQMQLRKYLLEKRKCFMVVAEFRDVLAAERIYEICDGLELEESMNYYDLRFLPDNFKLENIIQIVTNTSNYEYCKVPRSLVFQNKIKYEWDVDIKRENFFKKLFEQEIMDERLANKLIDISDENSNQFSNENKIDEPHKNSLETKNNISVKKIKQKEKKNIENKKSKKSEFIFNPNDERFVSIYESRDYAIDVTHPNFRKSERGLKEILKEKRKYNETN